MEVHWWIMLTGLAASVAVVVWFGVAFWLANRAHRADMAEYAAWRARTTLPVHPRGPMTSIVYCRVSVYCRWCGGPIRDYVSGIRPKRFARDRDDHESKADYHEVCWCEAIEVQV